MITEIPIRNIFIKNSAANTLSKMSFEKGHITYHYEEIYRSVNTLDLCMLEEKILILQINLSV